MSAVGMAALGAEVTDEIRRRVDGISQKFSVGAHVDVSVTCGRDLVRAVTVSMYPDGICGAHRAEHIYGPTIDEALSKAEAWAATYEPIRREAIIRKLALDIIDLKDQHGNVTVAMLRGRKHSQADIDAHKDAACIRAGEMSQGAPFEVVA